MTMNLDSLVRRGLPPWQPSEGADQVRAWRRYNHPMIGTFRSEGRLVLFTLIGDTAQTVSVWAYALVPVADEDRFTTARFHSADEMTALADEVFIGSEAVIVAAKDLKVWLWTRREVTYYGEDGLLAAAAAALSDMTKAVENKRSSPEERFEDGLAHLEVAADDLADA